MRYDSEYWSDVDKALQRIPHKDLLSGRSVLITGATGMIGSAVAELLFRIKESGSNIEIFLCGRDSERLKARFGSFEQRGYYKYISFDIDNPDAMGIEADYIIHAAGYSNPEVYNSKPVETMLGNLLGLNSLLQMARNISPKRILFLSSSEVYGNRVGEDTQTPFSESDYGYLDLLNPRGCYPSAKRAAETLGVSYAKEYGVPFVSVRPGHIYGPSITENDNRATAQFTRSAVKKQDILMKSAGLQLRSYCYTLDCASAIITVLLNGKNSEAYNISNRHSVVTIRQIAETFAEEAGCKIVFANPSEDELKSYNLMTNSALNAEKLEKLGWIACFDLKEGVKKTIMYYGI